MLTRNIGLRWAWIVAFALVVGLVPSCQQSVQQAQRTAGERLLRVGDRDIVPEEFTRYLHRQVGLSPEELDQAAIDRLYAEFLAELLFAQAAEAAAVQVPPDAVAHEVSRLEALEAGGTLGQLELEARRTLLSRAYEGQILASEVRVTPQEVDEALGRAPRYSARNQMVFRQILVEDKKTADEIYRRVERGHESFLALARELSLGPDLGADQQVPLENLPVPARRVLSSLPEGGTSRPVKVGSYYYLFQLDARNRDPDPGRVREREIIEHQIFQDKLETLRRERLGELARAAGIEALAHPQD